MIESPPKEEPSWLDKPITGSMLKAAVHLLAGRSTAPETTKKIMEDFDKLMNSGDPAQATQLLKPEKRARGRPRIRPPEEERKHRDLGSYNLFVMKAQNVAGPDVKNHRAFMGLIGTFWKGMDPSTRDQFNSTYKGLLDHLNEKKKAGIKYDFAQELKLYERDNEIDTIQFFRGFMQQVKALPTPETKQEKEARLSLQNAAASIPAPVDTDENDDHHHPEHQHHHAPEHLLPPGPEVVVPDMVHGEGVDDPAKKKAKLEAANAR